MGLKPLTRDDSCNPFNKGNLEEVCGVILNYLSSKNDMDEWKNLTPYQQDGIIDRVSELEETQGIHIVK